MQVPIGMLIFWVHRVSDEHAVVTGAWYYQELYVPSSPEEKLEILNDIRANRCILLQISGTFLQICQLLLLSDRFNNDSAENVKDYSALVVGLSKENNLQYIFDDLEEIEGTSLALDILLDVEEDQEKILEEIRSGKNGVKLRISPDWSFSKDFIKYSTQG